MAERTVNVQSELKLFFGEKIIITPEFLRPEHELWELYVKLLRTVQGFNLLRDATTIPYKDRTIKLGPSGWEKAIPIVHYWLQDQIKSRKTRNQPQQMQSVDSASVIGTTLHDASPLFNLIRFGKGPNDIENCFPTHTKEFLAPYIQTLSCGITDIDKVHPENITKIWKVFQQQPALINLIEINREWLSQELSDAPFSTNIQKELEIRRKTETDTAASKLGLAYLSEPAIKKGSILHCEPKATLNTADQGNQAQVRMQLPVRFDTVISIPEEKNRFRYEFWDLKTGTFNLDYVQNFQALLMHLLAGHFIDKKMTHGIYSRDTDPHKTPPIRNIIPRNSNYSFIYKKFDIESGTLEDIPVLIDYKTDLGELFLKWLRFYFIAFVAFKKEINLFLKKGQIANVTFDDFIVQKKLDMGYDEDPLLVKELISLLQ